MAASGFSALTLSAAISASSASRTICSALPCRFSPTVNRIGEVTLGGTPAVEVDTIACHARRRQMDPRSGVEEHRLLRALQVDVEAVQAGSVRVGLGQQGMAPLRGHQREDRILGEVGVAAEVDAGEQALLHAAREQADVDVCGLQAGLSRYAAGLDGAHVEVTVL